MIHLEAAFAKVGTGFSAVLDYSTPIGFRAYLDCDALQRSVDNDNGGGQAFVELARKDMLAFADETGVILSDAQITIIVRRSVDDEGRQDFDPIVLSYDEALALSALLGKWSGDRGQDLQYDFLIQQEADRVAVAEGRRPSYIVECD